MITPVEIEEILPMEPVPERNRAELMDSVIALIALSINILAVLRKAPLSVAPDAIVWPSIEATE